MRIMRKGFEALRVSSHSLSASGKEPPLMEIKGIGKNRKR
jgi:hypothetical protein